MKWMRLLYLVKLHIKAKSKLVPYSFSLPLGAFEALVVSKIVF